MKTVLSVIFVRSYCLLEVAALVFYVTEQLTIDAYSGYMEGSCGNS